MNDGPSEQRINHSAAESKSIAPINASRVTVLLLAFTLLVTALYPLCSAGSSAALAEPYTSSGSLDRTPLVMPQPHWSDRGWDWDLLKDDKGYVGIIVSVGNIAGSSDSVERVASLFDSREGSATSGGDQSSSFVIRERYSLTFNGFSARVKLDELKGVMASHPEIQIYPDLPVKAMLDGNIQQVGADQMWVRTDSYGHSVSGYGITVAVIDTGVDYMHPDLGGGFGSGYRVLGGYDFVDNDPDPMDENGHGTHVAGIIGASGGMTGVAPNVTFLAYRALGRDGSGSMSDVVASVEAALDPNNDGSTADHADIISMSLGGAGYVDDPICVAVQNAVEQGVVVVVAAGNSGPSLMTVASPGISPYAITVGAVNDTMALASFSSRGPTVDLRMKPDVSAPGVSIRSTVPYSGTDLSSPTGYMQLSGTSMATPHVSGAAALLLQLHPGWSPLQIKSALVTGALDLDEPAWLAGSGQIWVPSSADADAFSSQPLISYGLANAPSQTITISNAGPAATFSVTSLDFFSLGADGVIQTPVWTNITDSTPASVTISSGGQGQVVLSVTGPWDTVPQGYYDGQMTLTAGSRKLALHFGFVILSRLNVHVMNLKSQEVFDPNGGVWAFSLPDASIAVGVRGSDADCAPPASFLVPSGTYSVHAAGHQLVYTFSDPYILSDVITIGRMQTLEVSLNMTQAHPLTIDLTTDAGHPIYVKDYRLFVRHVGGRNLSFDITGSDYSIEGSELFSLRESLTIYVSDTDQTLGISIAGFSYSPKMWNFMEDNWPHWYDTPNLPANFVIEASADLQYLLSWEFTSIDGATPSNLLWDESSCRAFVTKYNVPGTIDDPWCQWGYHLGVGGDATFWVRRDTDTSLNQYFSGMTRTTFVKGVFSELYYPTDILNGYVEREFYTPNYDYLVRAATASEIYLPNRNYLTPLPAGVEVGSVGMGPYYPTVYTENTNDAVVLFQPLLRDQSNARVGSNTEPILYLKKDGFRIGIYMLAEFLARPDAERIIDLSGNGAYTLSIDNPVASMVSNDISIEIGFTVPSSDLDPPRVTGFQMPQRFVPGQVIHVQFSAVDTVSSVTSQLSWRPNNGPSWTPLTVTTVSPGVFETDIQTYPTDQAIDLSLRLEDATGNYLQSVIYNASVTQIPVVFDLSPSTDTVEYENRAVPIVLTGQLTDAVGNPLSSEGAVPLELTVNGEKVGMILDEYIDGATRSHNGSIRFEWLLNPTDLFSGPGEAIDVRVTFDLGLYQPITRTFTIRSVPSTNTPPTISLTSPGNNSLIAAGRTIDLAITDDGTFTASYSLDGGSAIALASPWDIDTSAWSEGSHVLSVSAVDDDLASTHVSFTFDIDANAPQLSILSPANGSLVPSNSTLIISASDAHLSDVRYRLDTGSFQTLSSPYQVSMTSWSIGQHTVQVTASDSVGHQSRASVTFEIADSTVVVGLVSPSDGAVIQSGVHIVLSVIGTGTISCEWSEGGATTPVFSPYDISTTGWSEGTHDITVIASDSLGASYQIRFSVTIDDTAPAISLLSPTYGSFVTTSDSITFQVTETNFYCVAWNVSGIPGQSTTKGNIISLSGLTKEGPFVLDVTAYDLAGNSANEIFAFALDIYPPTLGLIGASPGGAIAVGAALSVSAHDAFLSRVALGIDGTALTDLPAPYGIDTSQLSAGWHVLNMGAFDSSGKHAFLNVSIYVDATPPVILTDIAPEFHSNESFEIIAHITDDFAVSNATLFYQLESGGYSSIDMQWTGNYYLAEIPAGSLWDGMLVYVRSEDTVGNIAQSTATTLSEANAPPDDSNGKTPTDGQGSWLTSWMGIASIIAILAAIAVIAILLFMRRGEEEEEVTPVARARSTPARPRPAVVVAQPMPRPAPYQARTKPVQSADPVRSAPVTTSMTRPASPKVYPAVTRPAAAPPSPIPEQKPEPTTTDEDYIAKELSELQEQVSLLRKDVVRAMRRAGAKGSEVQQISGLGLKKLMDSEEDK